MEKIITNERALELIASYVYDVDIPMEMRVSMVIGILQGIGIDYSEKEVV